MADKPIEPLEPFIICEEPTYEGLVKMLSHGQPSVGLFSDEGGRFIGGHGMTKENLVKTAAGLSGMWDGKPISRVRSGDDLALLVGRRVSFHLMAQPEVSRLMLSNSMLLEQGLLSRCLVTWPQSTAGTRLYREIDLSENGDLKAYTDQLTNVLKAQKAIKEGTRNELNPMTLTLDADAKKVWIQYHDAVEQNLKDGGDLAPIRGLANKAAEHAARLAGVLTVISDLQAKTISLHSIRSGIQLVTHYLNEALRLFDTGACDPQMIQAQKLRDWLAERPTSPVSLVEIYQQGPRTVRTAKSARALIAVLVEHGHVTPAPDGVLYEGIMRREAFRVASNV